MTRIRNKVLVAAPTSSAKDYCMLEWIEMLKGLTYPWADIYLVDNSPDPDHVRQFWEQGIFADWHNPQGKSPVQFIAESQNKIREYFLDGDYTHLMFIESDVFTPPNIIEYFLWRPLPLVSAMYFVGEGTKTSLQLQIIEDKFRFRRTRLMNLDENFAFIDGTQKEVFACGLGCVLIQREIIKQVGFKYRPSKSVDSAHFSTFSDTYFYSDLTDLGVPVFVDTSITVQHKRKDWDSNIGLMKHKL